MCTNHIFCIFSRIHTHVIFHVFERFCSYVFILFGPIWTDWSTMWTIMRTWTAGGKENPDFETDLEV